MKKLLVPIALLSAVFFTACDSKKEKTDREMVLLTDSMYKSNLGSDTAAITQQQAPVEAEPEVAAPVVKTRKPAPRRTNNTYNERVQDNNSSIPAPVVVANPTPSTSAPTGTTGTQGDGTGTTASTPEVKKKEGMSKAAQGAIIGGVGGAVAGAVIGKKKGQGAVIGGVIGAAGGYILGRKKDKNDGRVPVDTSKN